jgi:ABC-type multidrug transport system fused ATPase/permease subunit
MRAIIVGEVFAKALRREDRSGTVKKGKDGQDESSSDGKVNNLVSVDAFAISEVCAYTFYIASCPFALFVNLGLLFMTLGPAAGAGVAVLVALIPLSTLMGRLFTVFQRRLLSATDKRLDAVTEVISYIKLIKYNSWQSKFLERMAITRKSELGALAQRFAIMTLSNVLVWATPVFVTGTAFGVHVLVLKQPLTPDKAFASLVLFNMLRDPLALFQDVAIRLIAAYASICRIQDFLNEPETLKYTQVSTPGPSDPAIGFHDALFAYPGEEAVDGAQPFRLGELDLSFPKGELSLVTGPVGSGKTTLILSLLGETVLLTGKVFMPNDRASRDLCPVDPATGLSDTVAYCAQTAWLVGATIRENIVFGATWDEARYKAVVHACALERDFEIFDLGDETEVGEKGTTCSGGQKARIALARALYSPAATVILDDVLSAVDAQTARHIYEHVLKGPLMKGRTCVLVTHAVGLCLPAASFVVMLDDGKAVSSGTPAMLVASGALEAESEPSTPVEETPEPATAEAGLSALSAQTSRLSVKTSRSRRRSVLQGGDVDDSVEDNLDGLDHDALMAKKRLDALAAGDGLTRSASRKSGKGDTEAQPDKRLVQDEESNQGSIRWGTYLLYFRAQGGVPFWLVLFVAFIGSQLLQFLSTWWIKEWAGAGQKSGRLEINNGVLTKPEHSVGYYLWVYLAISGVYLVMIAARIGVSFMGSLHASEWVYKRMLARILGAKLRFFDATPSGRIMNRLSKDMSSVDQETTLILMLFVNCVLSCATVLVVVAYSSPAFLVAFPIITVLYWIVGTLYVTTSREIKRYDSVTRSPIFVSFSEALVGMSTIRSYADSARFMSKLLGELDTNTRCFWYLWQANRALNILSNFIGTLITVCAAVLALRSEMDAATAGLSITYALSFTDYVLWVVRLYVDAEMTMNSVERIAECESFLWRHSPRPRARAGGAGGRQRRRAPRCVAKPRRLHRRVESHVQVRSTARPCAPRALL